MERKISIAEASKETIVLRDFILEQKDGAELSYLKIEDKTGIRMNSTNKQRLRSALRMAKKEYSTIFNYGIKLADNKSAMGIISHKLEKIDRAVKRGEKTQRNIQEQFFETLQPLEQKNILFLASVFGAIRVAAENGRIIYTKKTKEIEVDKKYKINVP